jgi:hypothetical protein
MTNPQKMRMKRRIEYAALMVVLLLVGKTAAQEEEPQLAEYLPSPTQRMEAASQRRASLDRAFHAMYDLDFAEADAELARFSAERPSDPLGPATRAANLLFSIFERHKVLQSELFTSFDHYAKRNTIVIDEPSRQRFVSNVNLSEKLAKQTLKDRQDEDALFALALVYGLQADYAALIEHRDFAALGFSDIGNGWARKLLAVSPGYCDAYVATGMQKYLVSLKPAPVRWILRLRGVRGNQDEGIHELELAAEKGRYLSPFARILLAVAHLRKEEGEEAFTLLRGLRDQFPHNSLFVEEMAKIHQQIYGTAPEKTSALATHSREKGQ